MLLDSSPMDRYYVLTISGIEIDVFGGAIAKSNFNLTSFCKVIWLKLSLKRSDLCLNVFILKISLM